MSQPAVSLKDRSLWLPAWAVDVAIMALILITALVPMPGGFPGVFPGLFPGGGPGGFPSGGPGQGPQLQDQHLALIGLGIALVTVAAVPLRRRWPLPVYLFSLVVYVLAVSFGFPALAPGIGAVVAVFAVANNLPRLQALSFGAAGAVAVAIISLFINEHMVLEPQVFQIAAGIAIATALGDSARSRREYTQAAMERAERAEQTREAEARRRVAEERLRIAQDLHDTVAHRISVISLNAGVASSLLETRPDKAKESLATIRSASRDVLGDIGVLLRYLRTDDSSGQSGQDGASAYLVQPGFDDIDALVASMKEAGLMVEKIIDGEVTQVDETTGRVAYRIAQEGLTNAHKHGSGGTAQLKIAVDNTNAQMLNIEVINPATDSDRNQPDAPQGHLGLTGLKERVGAVGGKISTSHAAGKFILQAELPLRSQRSNREEK
jgi:signal transduction histidine kinase